ncbi:Myb/SANT-like DNA-binding domain-containing protein [Carex littledalei]|uniref:Myb/SANT-like DNA-binding domain-containing protein n=1 Tax=Carex littledalei TaxID=544730 RepID=A0A833QZW0_9POAL|nr:Myb/SANT-like DNA-binding domain-containing protein [Carex littledalei]
MDPTLPCIVQALRAAASVATTTTTSTSISISISTPATKSQPSISRCTRSRAAPDWSVADTLVLIEQIAAVDAELWSKSLSSFQKWKIVADNCAQIGFHRSSNQCKRRWELLVSDYKKIRRWETMRNSNIGLGPGSVSYWRLDPDWRERSGLPGLFNFEVYGAMDAVIKIEGSRDIDSELLVIGPIEPIDGENNANANANPLSTVLAIPADNAEAFNAIEHHMHAPRHLDQKDKEEIDETLQSSEAWDLAAKLQENAEHIQSILKGENGGDICDNIDMAVAREKAEELIKSLGGLVQSLDEFTELVKSNGLEKVVALNSYSPM